MYGLKYEKETLHTQYPCHFWSCLASVNRERASLFPACLSISLLQRDVTTSEPRPDEGGAVTVMWVLISTYM